MATFSELGRVEAIKQLFEGSGYDAFAEPGWFYSANEKSACTVASRLFLEGIDFDLVYFPLKHLGYKTVLETTGELLAVMANPRTLSLNMGVSAKLDFEQIRQIWEGAVSAAHEFGYASVSLDLQPSHNGLTIAVSASGETSALGCSRRPKAKTKDLICVSGRLGAAYMGLQLLEREKTRFNAGASAKTEAMEQYRMLVGAYLKPELPSGIVKQMEDSGIYPSHGYLVTKGLSDAILRLSRDSGLGAKVYADKIPFEGNTFALGKELDIDPVSAAMNGGDDCQLLYTVPILELEKFRRDFQSFDIIGHLALPEAGTVLVTPDGVEFPIKAQGWQSAA